MIDFHGYSWLVDTNPRTALLAAQLLAHYPERCLDQDTPKGGRDITREVHLHGFRLDGVMSGFPPRGLGRCLLVDAPAVFASTWSAVRGILNEVTSGKKLGETIMKVMVDIWPIYFISTRLTKEDCIRSQR